MREKSIIPVLSLADEAEAYEIADIALEHGFSALEITLRTPRALDIIAALRTRYGRDLTLLCGTVLSAEQGDKALKAGADYLVSPGMSQGLRPHVEAHKDIYFAGVASFSETMDLYELGLRRAKLFPAELLGGIAWLKALQKILPDMRFFPTGGISADNVGDYLKQPNVIHVGGTWLAADKSDKQKIRRAFAEAQILATSEAV